MGKSDRKRERAKNKRERERERETARTSERKQGLETGVWASAYACLTVCRQYAFASCMLINKVCIAIDYT